MDKLQLHSTGPEEHFLSLQEKMNSQMEKIKGNPNLTPSEKETQLKSLKAAYKKDKKQLPNNLY